MSATEHDAQKGADAVNYSALNLNKHFLEKLKEAGGSLGTCGKVGKPLNQNQL